MPERIVVGVDGSDTSRNALVWSAHHAIRRGAALEIVLAWQSPAAAVSPMGVSFVPPPVEQLRRHALGRLEALVAEFAQAGRLDEIDYELTVAEGEASRRLCEVAKASDILVVGSRGLGGFKGLMLGSVSARCANAAPCPVAIIPPDWDPAIPACGAVVVGVDGSANANHAVRWVDCWAPDDASLRLVCAWTHPDIYALAEFTIDDSALEAACLQTAHRAAELVSRHAVEPRAVQRDARLALAAAARQSDALVIGACGHGRFSRLLLGSVASSTVHNLVVPTIIVPAEDDE